MNVVKADRLAQAALPLRLDADAVRADGRGAGAGQPVERRPRAAGQPVHAADLVAGAGRGGVPGRRGVRLPQHRAARLRRARRSASRCWWACSCSARWWAAGGAGSTSAPFHLQPSELMQLLTIVALGKYLNDSPALEGRTWRHLAIPVLIVSAAGVADREPARLRHGVPAAADLLQHHDDRAPQAEDAGGDHGARDDRGVPDLPAPAARVSAQARRGVLQPQLGGGVPGAAGAERDRFGAVLRQGVPARHADPPAALPGAVDRLPVRGVGRGVGLRRLRGAAAGVPGRRSSGSSRSRARRGIASAPPSASASPR